MIERHLSDLSQPLSSAHRTAATSHNKSEWQIDDIEAPFEYFVVHTAESRAVSEVGSIEQIAERFIAGGGAVVSDLLEIPGIGMMISCEDAIGQRFSFIEEEQFEQQI